MNIILYKSLLFINFVIIYYKEKCMYSFGEEMCWKCLENNVTNNTIKTGFIFFMQYIYI